MRPFTANLCIESLSTDLRKIIEILRDVFEKCHLAENNVFKSSPVLYLAENNVFKSSPVLYLAKDNVYVANYLITTSQRCIKLPSAQNAAQMHVAKCLLLQGQLKCLNITFHTV